MRGLPMLLAIVVTLLAMDAARAADWPQYKGPDRNDVSRETGLAAEWPTGGPPLSWTYADAGTGLSAPVIVGNRLYLTGGRGEEESLIALDLPATGTDAPTQAWSVPLGTTFDFKGNNWSRGPSASPTVDGNFVYALSGRGRLVAVDAPSGKTLWSVDLPTDLAAEVNPIGGGPKNLGWGFTWAPFVDGDRLICIPGGPQGTLAALDKRSGKVLWRSADLTHRAAYASAMAAEIGGVRQYVVLVNEGLYGVAAEDGKLLWSWDRPGKFGTEVVNSPIVQGEFVYATVGTARGCTRLRVQKTGTEFVAAVDYENANLSNHHGNVVLLDGHVYGATQGRGWVCQNFDSGEIVWAERSKFPAGSVTCAEGRLYCYGESNGEVALIAASPVGWKESGRFKIPKQTELRKPSGRIWSPPVISGGRLFLRDQDLLFCYDVRAAK